MPTKKEKDALTGQETTGHEWDGIEELNNPLPKWWLYVFYACIVWAVGYMILYPALPGLNGYTKGLLGWDRRAEVQEEIQQAQAAQSRFLDGIRETELAGIMDDADLLNFSLRGGQAAFADNCAACHGQGGAGRPGGYPALVDDAWLWGGELEQIHQTIAYGVRNQYSDSRSSMMPAFGNILDREEVNAVAEYVLSLSGEPKTPELAEAGSEIFANQCTACHGPEGGGMTQLGAPALNDNIWLYGGERSDLRSQISNPQHGVMPAWEPRLGEEMVKMLAVYVHALGGGQ